MQPERSSDLAQLGDDADAPARPSASRFCAQCDADIRAVAPGGICPACKTPAILSDFVRGPLTALPRATLKTIESGTRLVGTATLLWAGAIVLLGAAVARRTHDTFRSMGAEAFALAAVLVYIAACLMLLGFRSTAALPPGTPRLRDGLRRRDLRQFAGWGLAASAASLLALAVPLASGGSSANVLASAIFLLIVPAALFVVFLVMVAIGATGWLRLSESLAIRAGSSVSRSGRVRAATGILIPLPLFLAAGAWVALAPETSPSVRVSDAWAFAATSIVAICHAPAILVLGRAALRLRRLIADAHLQAPASVDYPGRPTPDQWREPRLFGLGSARQTTHEPNTCALCEYDLAGLASGAPCPECNAESALAHARPAIVATEPTAILGARAGILLVGWFLLAWSLASLTFVILGTISPWGMPMWTYWSTPLLTTVCGIGASLGLWRAASVVLVSRSSFALVLARLARICAIIAVPALLVGWTRVVVNGNPLFATGSAAIDSLLAVLRYLYILWIVLFWLVTPLILRHAARRLHAQSLHRWSSWTALIAMSWIGVMYGVVYTLMVLGMISPATMFGAAWSFDGPIRGLLHLVTAIIALRLARRLRIAAESAAALRHALPQSPQTPPTT